MGYRGDVGTPNAVTIIPVMATTGEIFFPMIRNQSISGGRPWSNNQRLLLGFKKTLLFDQVKPIINIITTLINMDLETLQNFGESQGPSRLGWPDWQPIS